MTYAPQTLIDLGRYWTSHGGVNLGVVGDARHAASGGYHEGRDDLVAAGRITSDYSVQTARDRAGLTNAASAIDLGLLNGSLTNLRRFSAWFANECRSGRCPDVREVIWWDSTQGRVLGWTATAPHGYVNDYGDLSHKTHTHISFFRDSEHRTKVAMFSGYFAPAPGGDMPPFNTYSAPKFVTVPPNTRLHTNADLSDNNDPSTGDKILSSQRDLPLVGILPSGAMIVGYRDETPTELVIPTYYAHATTPKDYPAPTVDCTAAVKAATDPLKAQVTSQAGQIAALTQERDAALAQVSTAADAEQERIAKAEADRIRAI